MGRCGPCTATGPSGVCTAPWTWYVGAGGPRGVGSAGSSVPYQCEGCPGMVHPRVSLSPPQQQALSLHRKRYTWASSVLYTDPASKPPERQRPCALTVLLDRV